MNKQRGTLWYALIVFVVVGILLFFSVWCVATQPLAIDDIFTDGDENLDFSCGNGEGYGPIPFPQCYVDCITTTQNTLGSGIIAFRGVNLAGGEFEGDDARNGAFLTFDNDAKLFVYKGMNTFRIPIAWEYTDLSDTSNYMTKLDRVIRDLTTKECYVVLDLHNYMRYNPQNVTNTDPDGDDVIKIGMGEFIGPRDFVSRGLTWQSDTSLSS